MSTPRGFFPILLLLISCSGCSSCQKAENPVPDPPHGTAGGMFTPSYAELRVTATRPGEPPVTASIESSGSYYFTRLPVGTYTLVFEPSTNYLIPPPQSLRITADANTVVPPVALVRNTATLLTGKRWRLSAYTTTAAPGAAPLDRYATLASCERDDYFVMRADGSGEREEGATTCLPSVPPSAPLSWQLRENETELWLFSPATEDNPYFIEHLSATTLTVRYYPTWAGMTAYRKTFTAF